MKSAVLLSVSALVLTLALLLFVGVPQPGIPDSPRAAIQATDRQRVIYGYGFLEPESEVRRLKFRAEGVIQEVYATVGQRVSREQPLMSLSTSTLSAQVKKAESLLALAVEERERTMAGAMKEEIMAARSEVDLRAERHRFAGIERARIEQLCASHAATAYELTEADTKLKQAEYALAKSQADLKRLENLARPEDVAIAQAKVKLAEAEVDYARERLNEAVLVAPTDGIVLEILRREGEVVTLTDGVPPMVFADDSKLRVRVEVDELYIQQVKVGQPAVIGGPNLHGLEVRGRVVEIRNIMGPKTVFTRDPSERRDLDVGQVLIELVEPLSAPLGLQVDVRLEVGSQ